MSVSSPNENNFISKITGIIEDNLPNEMFGVSELADETGMSRSNLLRKVKKLTDLSVSQFIRQIRLKHAMEYLEQGDFNVSEISFKVGFSSTSYFIKCFREQYGYPPGEVGKREIKEQEPASELKATRGKRNVFIGLGLFAVVLIISILIFFKPYSRKPVILEKSIAVLPFINDSNDSSNVYIINGLMESILNNLQKIEEMRVISRTSVEKYRTHRKTIPEMAEELNVNYFVEGSGQKIGDQILLNVQLIKAENDEHLWAEQYTREVRDIFQLQREVAKKIAEQIEVIMTPEEQEQIDKVPTDNLLAYDNYLKGVDFLNKQTAEGLDQAIVYFKKAVELDAEFALAYANLAISYFFTDIFQAERKSAEIINFYADKAFLLDGKLPQALIAKSLYYIYTKQNKLALPYLEKALEYHPNSARVLIMLSEYYTNVAPNTEKYLEYALRGIRINKASLDSTTASNTYLHLSNAFIQSGFVDEALKYINQSLAYNPNNLYSQYLNAYLVYAKNRSLEECINILIEALNKDLTRLDIMKEVGKIYYYMRDYENSLVYFEKFDEIRKSQNLNIYVYENAIIGEVYSRMGMTEKADDFFDSYKQYADGDQSIYKNLSLAMYFAHYNDNQNTIKHLELFSQQENYSYWNILFLPIDPLMDSIKDLPETQKVLNQIESNFWKNHHRIKKMLEEEGLL